MSKGVRIYEHRVGGRRVRRVCYNVGAGIRVARYMQNAVRLPVAVGCEEGAMVAHYVVRGAR